MSELAEQIVELFKGRAGWIARGSNGRGFAPEPVKEADRASLVDDVHLAGAEALGFYVLDDLSRCWLGCADFDNKPQAPDPHWQSKAEALRDRLAGWGLGPVVERSQSGEGAHVWLFFSEPVPGWLCRQFFAKACEAADIRASEIYPRQDRLAGRGFGNLVRYPLWNRSAFVDPSDGWRELDPKRALLLPRMSSVEDLRFAAMSNGAGELVEPEMRAPAVAVEGLTDRVKKLVGETFTLLGQRWLGNSAGMSDTSGSAIALSIASELVRCFVPTAEICAAVHHWCGRHNCNAYSRRDEAGRDEWVTATVAKAYDYIVSRVERKSLQSSTFEGCCAEYIRKLRAGGEFFYTSGIPQFDQSVQGIAPGELCVVAARPSHGKSAFGFQYLDNVAGDGTPALLISNEMAKLQIGKRRLLSIANIPFSGWSETTAPMLESSSEKHHAGRAPVYVCENCYSIDRIDEVIDQHCALRGVGFVAVDYLQLCRSVGSNKQEEVADISRRLKAAAVRNNCGVLALAQLNRSIEHRAEFDPMLSDLRDSGQIEQDADLVVFLVWPWKRDPAEDQSRFYISFPKRRNGEIKDRRIELIWEPNKQRFRSKKNETG